MFQVGDAVVYPAQGAGRIVEVVEREVMGSRQQYYVVQLLSDAARIMVPVGAVQEAGLRPPLAAAELERLWQALAEDLPLPSVWMPRYREEQRLLASGDPFKLAALVGTLYRRDQAKPLASSERRLYEDALTALASEVALSLSETLEAAKARVTGMLEALTPSP